MSLWTDLTAELDAAVYAFLADDTAATWTRGAVVMATLAAMLDRAERADTRHGMASIETVDVVRLSAAQVEAAAPGLVPVAGDAIVINGAPYILHGQPWRDDAMDGRDWLCPVNL